MNVERTISARRVEVKASPASLSATVTATAPRVVTLHERFSQLPKVEPKKKEEKVTAKVLDLNLFQEAGVNARRQATGQRQGSQRDVVVAARRSIATTTWTPSFDDDDNSGPRVNVNLGADALRSANGGRRRQFEVDRPSEPAFIIKGIPPPQPRQRTVMAQQSTTRTFSSSAPRGGRSSVVRGGRIIEAMPPTRGARQAGNQRGVSVRGGRGGGAVRGGRVVAAGNQRAPVASVGSRGGRGAARGGRGGARGGKTDAAAAKPKSKDALDAELDSYMLQTPETAKSYLDQQLEEYMHAREQESASS